MHTSKGIGPTDVQVVEAGPSAARTHKERLGKEHLEVLDTLLAAGGRALAKGLLHQAPLLLLKVHDALLDARLQRSLDPHKVNRTRQHMRRSPTPTAPPRHLDHEAHDVDRALLTDPVHAVDRLVLGRLCALFAP